MFIMEQTQPSLKNLTGGFGNIPDKQNEFLQSLGKPHVDSFNFFLKSGLGLIVKNFHPVQFNLPSEEKVTLSLSDLRINSPLMADGSMKFKSQRIYPSECRQRGASYKGKLIGTIHWTLDERVQQPIEIDFGDIPLMVKSDACHLSGLTPKQLIERGEHTDEWGGYFIIKGYERLIRMLLMQRRNYPIAIIRSTWKQRGHLFSDKGIMLRCVSEAQTSTNNVLHFLTDGTAKLMFSHSKSLYYVPIGLILKSLIDVTDQYIYQKLMLGKEDDLYYKSCVVNMLQLIHRDDIGNHLQAKKFIGDIFKIKFQYQYPNASSEEICDVVFKRCIAIHLDNNEDKFNLLVFMTQKLFAFVQNKCCVEGADAVMMQELLLGGHLYLQVLKERLEAAFVVCKMVILKKATTGKKTFSLNSYELHGAFKKSGGLERSLENFLATGNVNSQSGLGLMQDKGLTIVAENINRMRYMSHFKAVHRGSYFLTMRTTESRQLLPDAWGFICPVHTPDGAPCGLLNHLGKLTEVTNVPDPLLLSQLPQILTNLGMIDIKQQIKVNSKYFYTVMLDGRVIGWLPVSESGEFVTSLRKLKIEGKEVPSTLEIVLVPIKDVPAQYSGLFLFTGPARMMRPVLNLKAQKVEFIGTFEQVYLNVCLIKEEQIPNVTTHQELSETAFLSNLACLIPMPDCNQSPRNMYQCQMGKQTMGQPCHNWHLQAETKAYRLQTPSSPLFRPVHYDNIKLDDFAMGTNAIVAVISYTGYDMEDAMIINKSSYERGFAHGSILKSEFIDLKGSESYFERDPSQLDLETLLSSDGLPYIGSILTENAPMCCYYDQESAKYHVEKFHGKELVYVDNVRLCSGTTASDPRRACITMRLPRNPSVGDKFASRAGQKGICSQLWAAEDLPFTDSGLVPDIVFNPHGFPSRMTIAMMIELMAGKSAALNGTVHDATPFEFREDNTAIEYFGKLLEEGGYNYYGTERMYSGVDGRELDASIFFGVVYYQRLRHMVLDKWQVRSVGPVDSLTQQPLKGRRKGGGVRFGEMERDSLISHGASFLLRDRLFNCSDNFRTSICVSCCNLLSPVLTRHPKSGVKEEVCRLCPDGGDVQPIDIPYIFRFLLIQFASVNINVKVKSSF